MAIMRVGIDLGKNVFDLFGVDERGKPALSRRLSRNRLREFFAQVPPVLIGMEACATSHYWARELIRLGHEVRLMAPKFVAPYRKSDKNDGNDAEAICEAVGRPTMRFVPIKTPEQQAVLTLHRARAALIGQRTALAHQACRRGYRAYYRRASRLFDDLRVARADGTYGRLLGKLARMDVLLLDDWGLAPPPDQERRDLLEILEDRYGSRSTIVTSQLPPAQWHDHIGEATLADAICDRLLHNAHRLVLKGPSRRKEGQLDS